MMAPTAPSSKTEHHSSISDTLSVMKHHRMSNLHNIISFFKKENLRAFFNTHQHLISPIAIALGFIIDNFTLTRIDQTFDNLILITYLLITTICVLFLHSHTTSFSKRLNLPRYHSLIFGIMNFGFGGLFSGFIVFYSRSASILTGWPFVLLLLILMLGGEKYKRHYSNITLQLSALYIAYFAYFIFLIPLLTNKLGTGMFLLSGLTSLLSIGGVLWILRRIDTEIVRVQLQMLISIILGIFLLFQFFYFTNIMPPIPLSLKYANVYQNVSRSNTNTYTLSYQATSWFNIFRKRSHQVDQQTQKVFVFSAIFAPTDISTTLYHQWYHKGPSGWERTDKIALPINGGRDDGYRGFTNKTNLTPGKWRVRITTARNQELGRVRFTVTDTKRESKIRTEVR
ncbi:MAG: hypothetical protein ACI83D_000302 [Planctomycetota bacterium]|jgi:hypothetical protein